MKLYNIDNSPFAARVRMQICHKGLPVDLCSPKQATRTPEFRAAYPLGKIPTLELDDGTMIGESTVIMNYLESVFPDAPMLPSEPLPKAQNEMLVRYVDNHLSLGLSPLFQEFFGLVHSQQSPPNNDSRFDLLLPELQKLDRLLGELPSFAERGLQTGDLCIASNLYYVLQLAKFFGNDDILAGLDNVNKWHDWIAGFDAVVKEIGVMDAAHQALIKSLEKKS